MGRYCRVCGRHRPHEQFGGRGQRAIICSKCRRLPREERMRVLWLDEIFGFLEQSNISKKNLRRLQQLEAEEIAEVASLASLTSSFPSHHGPNVHHVSSHRKAVEMETPQVNC